MKKKILLFILLLIPFMVNAKEKEVKITSAELVELSDGTTELSESTYNGLEMNLNLRFTEVGDKAKYKVVVENTTDEDYEVLNKETQLDSGYITYESNYEEDSNIIKSNTTKTLYITISYDKEVDDNEYTNGKYTESNNIIINLDTNKDNKNIDNNITVNPKTGIRLGIIISSIGLLMGIIALLVIKKGKTSKSLMLLLITLLLVPISIKAVSKLFIKVNSNIEIAKAYSVSYYSRDFISYFTNEEMESYNLFNEECNDVIYIGSVSEENKYTYCTGEVIWTDPDKHYVGDTVSLKALSSRYIALNDEYCERFDDYYLCTENVEIEDRKIKGRTVYDKRTIDSNGFIYEGNDPEVMGLDSEYWESSGIAYVSKSNSFIIPNHNVLFTFLPKFT